MNERVDGANFEMPMSLPDTHLDLGCGKFPRNPYGRTRLHGVDIRSLASDDSFEYRAANLTLEPIPYPDDSFGSVSAFDFIEHVPRLLPTADGRDTCFPFIRLMDEVWRVLAPGGKFYALTPAYPHSEAFVDPTHVNIITSNTHTYFCGDSPLARMYGFTGQFTAIRAAWVYRSEAFQASTTITPRSIPKRLARRLRHFSRRLRGKDATSSGPAYFLWELQAVKPAGTCIPAPGLGEPLIADPAAS